MWNCCGYNEEINLRDSPAGTVKGQNRFGLYIDLKVENDMIGESKEIIPVFGVYSGRQARTAR